MKLRGLLFALMIYSLLPFKANAGWVKNIDDQCEPVVQAGYGIERENSTYNCIIGGQSPYCEWRIKYRTLWTNSVGETIDAGSCLKIVARSHDGNFDRPKTWVDTFYSIITAIGLYDYSPSTQRRVNTIASGVRGSTFDFGGFSLVTQSPGWATYQATMPNDGDPLRVAFRPDHISDLNGIFSIFVGLNALERESVADYATSELVIGQDYILDIEGFPPSSEIFVEYQLVTNEPDQVIFVSDPSDVEPEPPPGC